jgi:hypothetical protein
MRPNLCCPASPLLRFDFAASGSVLGVMDTRGQIVSKEHIGQTTLSPIGAAVLLPLLAAVLFLSRRWAVAAFVAAVCFVSDAQRVTLAGLDFTPLRMLIAAGALRVLIRSEYAALRWKLIDTLFTCYALWGFAAYAMLYEFDPAALVRRAGEMYTYAGTYFLCRCWVRDAEDVAALGRTLAVLAVPSGLFFAAEWLTGRNVFSVFGGVSEFTGMRDGRLRCRGPFPHAILAGCFWAGACPLIASLFWRGIAERPLALVGLGGALLVIAACASSTPILALALIVAAASLYPLRGRMRVVQIGILLSLLAIHFVRDKPVWHLLGRVNVLGSSTGHHRYLLIDHAINNFAEWSPIGVKSTAHWGTQMFDVTNQYLLEGVRGGFAAMLLFTTVLYLAFRGVGRAVRAKAGRANIVQAWLVGAALFGHAATFFSVSYFGQVPVIFWSTIAAAVAVASPLRARKAVVAARPATGRLTNPAAITRPLPGCVGVVPVLQNSPRRVRWST